MRRASARWLALVAFAAGCSAHDDTSTSGIDPEQGSVVGDESKPPHGGGGGGMCVARGRTGEVVMTADLGVAGSGTPNNLALSIGGLLLVAPGDVTGPPGHTFELGVDGRLRGSFGFGQVLATDAAGHLYIAGGFSSPLDFGLGVMTPVGDIDTFIVELDASGKVIAQIQLPDCGDGVQSLAIALDGRIAMSGNAMGTVVLDHAGGVLFHLDLVGDVAFDAGGNLVIAGGSFGLVTTAFVAKFDVAGNRLFEHDFTGGFVASVAVGPNGEIGFVGNAETSIDLLGTVIRAHTVEGARYDGGFVAKLDASGALVFAVPVDAVVTSSVAIDTKGNIAVAGSVFSSLYFRQSDIFELDPAGKFLFDDQAAPLSGHGNAHGIAVDACGNVFVSVEAGHPVPQHDASSFVLEISH